MNPFTPHASAHHPDSASGTPQPRHSSATLTSHNIPGNVPATLAATSLKAIPHRHSRNPKRLGSISHINIFGSLHAIHPAPRAPSPANSNIPHLNRPTRRGRKSRAGKEVPILAQEHGAGAAQAPSRTHNGPTLASSPIPNTLNECYKVGTREAKQD